MKAEEVEKSEEAMTSEEVETSEEGGGDEEEHLCPPLIVSMAWVPCEPRASWDQIQDGIRLQPHLDLDTLYVLYTTLWVVTLPERYVDVFVADVADVLALYPETCVGYLAYPAMRKGYIGIMFDTRREAERLQRQYRTELPCIGGVRVLYAEHLFNAANAISPVRATTMFLC